jgi:thiamine-phosphate pyrophosphorylase
VSGINVSRYRRRVHKPGERLATASLYLCTDARRERGDLAEFADAALAGGVDIIQLRDKGSPGEQRFGPLEARQELEALEVLADAARRHDVLVAVNDRADIAAAAGADVLHLGQDDLPLPIARDIIGPGPLIGRSTHDLDQVEAAAAEAVDYFCVGPCWPTPTKPGRPSPGLDLVRRRPVQTNRGSRSAVSTNSGYLRCWRRALAESSSCARSPPPRTRGRRRNGLKLGL